MSGEQPRASVCKQWVRSDFLRSKVEGMVQRGKVHRSDMELLNGLCTAGSSDPVKRGMRVEVRGDGVLVAFASGEGDDSRFGLQSCIYACKRNPNVMQVFHMREALPVSGMRAPSVRSVLDKSVPGWSSMRSMPEHTVQDFITKKSLGDDSFFIVRRGRQSGGAQSRGDVRSGVVLRYKPDDALRVAEQIGETGSALLKGNSEESVQFAACAVNGRPGFKMHMVRGELERVLFVSNGLCGVLLEKVGGDGVYVHGLRAFAKAVSALPFYPEPSTAHVCTSFLDAAMAVRAIRAMRLTTDRPIRKGTPFAELAALLDIRKVDPAPQGKGSLAAHAFSNAPNVLSALDVAEEATRELMKLGMSDEAIWDAVLAARAASQGARDGLRLLNAPGFTGTVQGDFPVRPEWGLAFDFTGCSCSVSAYVVPYGEVSAWVAGVVDTSPKEERPDSALVFATDGRAFALYPVGSIRVRRAAMTPGDAETKGEVTWGYNSDVQAAVARLVYITGACRAHPDLLGRHEHALRSVWFLTERQRPCLRGNVHDICVLSCAGKNRSDSLQYSLLPSHVDHRAVDPNKLAWPTDRFLVLCPGGLGLRLTLGLILYKFTLDSVCRIRVIVVLHHVVTEVVGHDRDVDVQEVLHVRVWVFCDLLQQGLDGFSLAAHLALEEQDVADHTALVGDGTGRPCHVRPEEGVPAQHREQLTVRQLEPVTRFLRVAGHVFFDAHPLFGQHLLAHRQGVRQRVPGDGGQRVYGLLHLRDLAHGVLDQLEGPVVEEFWRTCG
eukprot:768544-Hanusia_phi.AAC.2